MAVLSERMHQLQFITYNIKQDDDEWKEHDAVDATNTNTHNDGDDDDTSESENSVCYD